MNNTLEIKTGLVELDVKRDGKKIGTISFNPSSVRFADSYYALYGKLSDKDAEYTKRAEALETAAKIDDNGVPDNLDAQIQLTRELFAELRSEFDALFGDGTCEVVFGESVDDGSFNAFESFLEGISPHVESARSDKVNAHLKCANRDTRRRASKAGKK